MVGRCFDILPSARKYFYKITPNEFDILFKRKEERDFEDRNLYIMTRRTTSGVTYVAIDNLTGDFFVEEFTNYNDALFWLSGLKEAEPLKKAEECEFWW